MDDYDRLITQTGTIDALATAALYGQLTAKTAVRVATIETLAVSVPKLLQSLSSILHALPSVFVEEASAQEVDTTVTPDVASDTKGFKSNVRGFTAAGQDTIHTPVASPGASFALPDTAFKPNMSGFTEAVGEDRQTIFDAGTGKSFTPSTEEFSHPGDFKPNATQFRAAAEGAEQADNSIPDQASTGEANITGAEQEQEAVAEYIQAHPDEVREMQRAGWYHNDTDNPNENELRTLWGGVNHTGIDADGNYVLDVGSMTEDGSFHGNLSANAQELLREGKLKFLISSEGAGNKFFEVDINADGKIIIDHDDPKAEMFFRTENGRAVFTGKFGEVVEEMEDSKFKVLSTIERSQAATSASVEATPAIPDESASSEAPPAAAESAQPKPPSAETPPPGTTEEEIRGRLNEQYKEPPATYQGYTPPDYVEPRGEYRGYNQPNRVEPPTGYSGYNQPGYMEPQAGYGGYSFAFGPGHSAGYSHADLPVSGHEDSLANVAVEELNKLEFEVSPEFLDREDFLELPQAEQAEILRVHLRIIDQIIPENLLSNEETNSWWLKIKNMDAKEFLKEEGEYGTGSKYQNIRDCLKILMGETGEKPKDRLLGEEESLAKFFARALTEAVKHGKLSEIVSKLSERKLV